MVSYGKFPENFSFQGVPTPETVERCLKDGPRGISKESGELGNQKGGYLLVGRGGAEDKNFPPGESRDSL